MILTTEEIGRLIVMMRDSTVLNAEKVPADLIENNQDLWNKLTTEFIRRTSHEEYVPITPHTRTGAYGKLIECPFCYQKSRVFHLNWSAVVCPNPRCKKEVDKYEFLIENTLKSSVRKHSVKST